MVTFADMHAAVPTIGAFAVDRIASTGLCFVATARQDGWPRVSPMELSECDGRLYVGSMPGAVKAKDLRRDPRCCVITSLADKDDLVGEVKMFCRAREVMEAVEWQRVRSHFKGLNGVDIGDPGDSHVFELDVEAAARQWVDGEQWRTTSWRVGGAIRERVRTGAIGESRDL